MKQSVIEENSLEKNKVYKMNVPPNIIDIVGVINNRNGEICHMTRSLQKIDDIYARYKNHEIELSKQSNRNIIKKVMYSPGVKFSLKKNIKDVLTGEFDVRDIRKFTSSILKRSKTRNHKNNLAYNGTDIHSPGSSLEFIKNAFTDINHHNTISHYDKSLLKTNNPNNNQLSINTSSIIDDYYNSSDKNLDPSMYALMHDKDYTERRSIILSLKKKLKLYINSRKTSPCKNSSYENSKHIANDLHEKIENQDKIKRQKTFYKSPYFGEIEVDRVENNDKKDNITKFNRQKTVVKSPYFGEIEVDRIEEDEVIVIMPEKKGNFNIKNQKSLCNTISIDNSDAEKYESRKTSLKKKISFLNQQTILKNLDVKKQIDQEFYMPSDMSNNNIEKNMNILMEKNMSQINSHENEFGEFYLNEFIEKHNSSLIVKKQKTLLKSRINESKENIENEEKLEQIEHQLILPKSLSLSPIKMKNSLKKQSDNSSLLSDGSRKNLFDIRPYNSSPEEFKINLNSDYNSINSQSKSDIQMPRLLIPTNSNSNLNIENNIENINNKENFSKNVNTEYYKICPTSHKTRSSSHNSSILKFKEELPSIYLNCKNIEKENKKIYGNISRLNIKTDKIIRNIKEKSHKKLDENINSQILLNSSSLSVNNSKNVFIYGDDQGHFYRNFNLLENSLSKIKDDFLHRVKSAIKGRLDINEKNIGIKKTSIKHRKVENILNSIDIIQGSLNKK